MDWILSVVPMITKNGKLWICIEFKILNLATPKDVYPMLVADQVIDSASKHEILSFMDNQIFIAEVGVAKTTLRCQGAI